MQQIEKTCELLEAHYKKYPLLQIQDVFKFLFQSVFGCEHMVSSVESAINYISEEYNSLCNNSNEGAIEQLDGCYCRVPLSYMNKGLCAETFGKLFSYSSNKTENGWLILTEKLEIAKKLIREDRLPFAEDEFEKAVVEWENIGFSPIHHSDVFRENYHPSYRVIRSDYIPFLPLFSKLDKQQKNGKTIVAIEGGSASGKTTLSQLLQSIYNCTVFHMDDFFLQPHQRTPERFAEVGGNIDWERFLAEVLEPLKNGEKINFKKFDCSSMTLTKAERITPQKLVIVEGVYSMHPKLCEYYDFSVFLNVSSKLQKERIMNRNSPQLAERFFEEWIPLENKYFANTNIKERCDLTINITTFE